MELSKAEIEFIQKHKVQFISLKYLDNNEVLKQIDVSTRNLQDDNLSYGSNLVNLNTHVKVVCYC